MRWRLSLLVALFCAVASAAQAHGWYEGLIAPSGGSCCNGRDCRPVSYRYEPQTGRLEVQIEGTWIAVNPATLLPIPSPDGQAHACFWHTWQGQKMMPMLRCVIMPGEA
jgi:hypothetical protein